MIVSYLTQCSSVQLIEKSDVILKATTISMLCMIVLAISLHLLYHYNERGLSKEMVMNRSAILTNQHTISVEKKLAILSMIYYFLYFACICLFIFLIVYSL